MSVQLGTSPRGSVPIHLSTAVGFTALAAQQPAATRQWLKTVGFAGAPDRHALVPGANGQLQAVWAGVRSAEDPWALAALPMSLPEGDYHLAEGALALDDGAAALSWELGAYRFDAYKTAARPPARLPHQTRHGHRPI